MEQAFAAGCEWLSVPRVKSVWILVVVLVVGSWEIASSLLI